MEYEEMDDERLLDLLIRFMDENEVGSVRTEGSYQVGSVPNPTQPAQPQAQSQAPPVPQGFTPPTGTYDTPEGISSHLAEQGAGLLQPGSDLSKRWMEQMREQIGDQTNASQRGAAYQAAQQGFGGGASPELMQSQTDLGVAGLEAAGDAASNFALRAPELGGGMMTGALGPQTSMRGQDLQSAQFKSGQELQNQQFQANQQMQQRQLDYDRQLKDQQLAMQRQQQQQDAKYRALAAQYSGLGGGGGSRQPSRPSYMGTSLGRNFG